MGILDFLGLKRPVASAEDMAKLQGTDEKMNKAGLQFAGKAGLCYRASGDCKNTLRGIVSYPRSSGITAKCSTVEDSYGCDWIVLDGEQDRVTDSAKAAFKAMAAKACEKNFLCAAFSYTTTDKKVYWIYNSYGRFYPFVPVGEERDSELEIALKRELEESIPFENALSLWYPLWGLPL